MEWRLVEEFVEGKSSASVCEDAIVANDHYYAVIDGATDETGARFAGVSGGRFAADVLSAEINNLPPSIGPRAFTDRLTRAMSDAVATECGTLDDDIRWPVASVVCFAPAEQAIWRIGDCNLVIDGDAHPGTKAVDDAAYSFRAVINAALLARGAPVDEVIVNDPGAAASRPLHDLQQHLANVPGPWGYGCINGRHVPHDFVEVIPVPLHTREVVLSSDGYPEPAMSLAESEARLKKLLVADPAAVGALWRMGKPFRPGFNAPDDRAYLRIAAASSVHP